MPLLNESNNLDTSKLTHSGDTPVKIIKDNTDFFFPISSYKTLTNAL